MPITIDKPSKYFDTTAYTGNGSAGRNLTTGTFQPDWIWIKSRSDTDNHRLIDAVRGATKHLESDTTGAEQTSSNVTAFTSTGITLSSNGAVNANAETYVVWSWLGANTTVSNTAGTISSTVSANTTSGFSIVSFTTTSGGNATIGHGLGSVPKMIIMKARDQTYNWDIYHVGIGNANRLIFTTASSAGTPCWGSTTPTSSVFTMDQSFYGSGVPTIAYCFAEVKGFSKAFSYTGNGSSDGTYVHLGFRPAFVMIKVTSTADDWQIIDNKRDPENSGSELVLAPNTSAADSAAVRLDLLSNGFKTRTSNVSVNSSGATYIGFAFAESPFVSSKGICTTAR